MEIVMHDSASIAEAIDFAISDAESTLHADRTVINPTAILKAIAHVETGYGARYAASLHEPGFCYGGKYYHASKALQRESVMWGCNAHSSHGPWQILYITANEFGYRDDPILLRSPKISIDYVIQILNKRVMDKLSDEKPEDIFDAWNSGNPRDSIVPEVYIAHAMDFYKRLA